MNTIHLKVITPKKIVREQDVVSVTVPAADGEITILAHHVNLFSLLKEGIITVRHDNIEDYMAIGGGYIETDGKNLNILVSRAYGQDEIDEKMTAKAIEDAQKLITEAKSDEERADATAVLRRSVIDMKLIKRKKRAA
jgi:F-type H+-transporting ATPase subunit epsilon